jgi:hypothetical protein
MCKKFKKQKKNYHMDTKNCEKKGIPNSRLAGYRLIEESIDLKFFSMEK